MLHSNIEDRTESILVFVINKLWGIVTLGLLH
mgnify:CR=1 FL=1